MFERIQNIQVLDILVELRMVSLAQGMSRSFPDICQMSMDKIIREVKDKLQGKI